MSLMRSAVAMGVALALWHTAGAAVPQTMRAAAIDAAGGPGVITLHTLPVPKPDADEVLIAVDTADVAVWDASARAHPEEMTHGHFPLVLGTDGSGVIAAVGAQVRGFKPGDPVYAYMWDNPKGGFYAEYVALPAKQVGHVPAGLSLRDAGAIAASALTAIQGIDDALHIRSGETLIIHGASGGVGVLALQFARLMGARVLGISSSDEKLQRARSLGLDAGLNYREHPDWDRWVFEQTDGEGGTSPARELIVFKSGRRSLTVVSTIADFAALKRWVNDKAHRRGIALVAYEPQWLWNPPLLTPIEEL